MKKIILLFIFISSPVFSQINFESGYFIDNYNVKTNCLIRNVGWQKNPTEIDYKLSDGDNVKKIMLSEIKEFNVGDSYKYRRFKTNLDRSSSDVNNLSSEKNPLWVEETLLLKILVEGEINLYQYEGVNLIRYFISTGNHEIAEQLVCKEYRAEYTDIGVNNYFRQQLLNTLKSNNLNINDFKNLTYKKKELTNLILKYNKTKELKSINYEINQNQGEVNLKIIAGVNATSLNISNYISNVDYTFDLLPVFHLGIESEYILPFNQKKWSIFTEPNFQSYKPSENTNRNQLVEAKYNFIEIPFGLRYHMFINNKSKLFIGMGMNLAFTSKSSITYSGLELEVSNSTNFHTSIGFSKGHYSAEIRYNLNREVIPTYISWQSKYNSIGILIGYKFL